MSDLLTHVLGFLLSLAATFLLMPIVMARQEPRTTLACGVYCLTLVLLYAASSLSHAFRDRGLRRMFRTLDRACIYLLIAGSMTPFAVVLLRQGRWWLFLPAMCGLAVAGVLFVLHGAILSGPVKITYGALGCLPVVAFPELSRHAPFGLLLWIVAAGAFYQPGPSSGSGPKGSLLPRSMAHVRRGRQHLPLRRSPRLCGAADSHRARSRTLAFPAQHHTIM